MGVWLRLHVLNLFLIIDIKNFWNLIDSLRWIGERAAKVSNNKLSNNKVSDNKVCVVRMRGPLFASLSRLESALYS